MTDTECSKNVESDIEVVRILHLSDTHNELTADMIPHLPAADILIHTGDFSNSGTDNEFHAFNEVLGACAARYRHRLVIYGNHDCFHTHKLIGNTDDADAVNGELAHWNRMRSMLRNATHVLLHERVDVCGLQIYGVPWHHRHNWRYHGRRAGFFRRGGGLERHKTAATATRETATTVEEEEEDDDDDEGTRFTDIPPHIDILMTHGPSYGVLDEDALGVIGHTGSKCLEKHLLRAQPRLHLFGHIHHQNGVRVRQYPSSSESSSSSLSFSSSSSLAPSSSPSSTRRLISINSAMKNQWSSCHVIVATRHKITMMPPIASSSSAAAASSPSPLPSSSSSRWSEWEFEVLDVKTGMPAKLSCAIL